MNFSKFLSLINGVGRTVDLGNSSNNLELGGSLQMDGSSSGHVLLTASASTTSYSLVLPPAQAAMSGYVLSNDGTGVLSWASASAGSVTSVALSSSIQRFLGFWFSQLHPAELLLVVLIHNQLIAFGQALQVVLQLLLHLDL